MNDYKDIMYRKHPTSLKHPRMSRINRAAQFAPFAALSGHDEAVKETARLVDEQIILDENRIQLLNQHIQVLLEHIKEQPYISITYFIKDDKKQGGLYQTKEGHLKKIDEYDHLLIFDDQTKISIFNIISIESSYE